MAPRLIRRLAGVAPPAVRSGAPRRALGLRAQCRRWDFVAVGAQLLRNRTPERRRSEVFDFQPFDATSLVIDARYPERPIGHWRGDLEAAITEAGLSLADSWNGAWAPPAQYDGGQDLFVVVKP